MFRRRFPAITQGDRAARPAITEVLEFYHRHSGICSVGSSNNSMESSFM